MMEYMYKCSSNWKEVDFKFLFK